MDIISRKIRDRSRWISRYGDVLVFFLCCLNFALCFEFLGDRDSRSIHKPQVRVEDMATAWQPRARSLLTQESKVIDQSWWQRRWAVGKHRIRKIFGLNAKVAKPSRRSQAKQHDESSQARTQELHKSYPKASANSSVDELSGIRVGSTIIYYLPDIPAFASAQTSLTAPGRQQLARIARKLRMHSSWQQIGVVGFTDGRPVVGHYPFKNNQQLSQMRGQAIRKFLARFGLPDATIEVVGMHQFVDKFGSIVRAAEFKSYLSRGMAILVKTSSE